MAHAQQQILDAIKAVLSAGGTVAGTRVFLDRVDPLQATELPAILIEEDGAEAVEYITFDALVQKRTSPVLVNCVLASSAAASDARAFGLAVEKLLAANSTLTTMCQLGYWLETSQTVNHGDADRLLAARQLRWRFVYRASSLNPDIINP
jgi:hypothetical protein